LSVGLLGGAFDPPHNGHVALAQRAVEHFGLDRLVVLVAARPGHKRVETPSATRLRLARAAFPDWDVELDEHERTVDTLREGPWRDPLFIVGADEFADFLRWKDPPAVLELAHLGVATRPGYPRDRLQPALDGLARPERVAFFELEPLPVSSSAIRARIARGEPIDGLVSPAVAGLVGELGLYRRQGAVH
jgi:nicotinate-nucleotide adenylyltransferase